MTTGHALSFAASAFGQRDQHASAARQPARPAQRWWQRSLSTQQLPAACAATPAAHARAAAQAATSWQRASASPVLRTASAMLPRRAGRSLFLAAAVFAGTALLAFSGSASGETAAAGPRNVLGQELGICSTSPMTGFFRDGRCDTGPSDFGTHTVCAKVTQEFLEYTLRQGNDLMTPNPAYRFPGLKPGDGWCLCASRWREAMQAGVAPPVVLEATHEKTLSFVDMASLQRHAAAGPGSEL